MNTQIVDAIQENSYSKTRSNPPQEGSQGEAPQRVLYFNLWRV
jgi:hypothetical protein